MLEAGAVKDQWGIPACTACAVVTAVESLLPGFEGSVGFVYHHLRAVERREGGLTIADALSAVQRFGVCSEALHLSESRERQQRPSLAAYRDARRRRIGIPVPLRRRKELQVWLEADMPVVFSYDSSILVRLGLHRPDENRGWHASAVLGHDLVRKAFLVQNSWGPDWNGNGRFWLPEKIVDDERTCRACFGVSL